jgi:hypothetical protein
LLWVWDLRCQTAQLIERPMDLAVYLHALRSVQLQRGAHQTAIGSPRHRDHYLQSPVQFLDRRHGWSRLLLSLCLQKQLWLIQKPVTDRPCCASPGGIQLSRFTAAQPVAGKSLCHAPAVFPTAPGHRHQILHRHMRRDRAAAHLLLHTRRKQFHQRHPPRHPTRAAIKTPRQLLQPMAEALLQFHQQPALFERCVVVPTTHGAIQKQSLQLAHRPDHRLHRVPAQLLKGSDSLIAVDHQITINLFGCDHDDRRLLAARGQRSQQAPLALRTAHAKVLQTPLKLVKFQPHPWPLLRNSNLHPIPSGIARQQPGVCPDLTSNQYHRGRTGIARNAAGVHP